MRTPLTAIWLSLLLAGVALAPGQLIQVTHDPAQDINPSAGNDVTPSFWVVWQTNRNGNWDIYGCGRPWPDWPDTLPRPVCTDSADDLHPVVVGSDWYSSSWCIWERREGGLTSTIWAARDTGNNGQLGWLPPIQIGRVVNTTGDSAFPSACWQQDSYLVRPWVVWAGHDTSGSGVYFTSCDGDSWRTPEIAYRSQNLLHHPRIGRGKTEMGYAYPLLVWEENGDILLSRYRDSAWTAAESVAPSAAYDCEPEVASFSFYGYPPGPFIVWQSLRDGDTAVYVTAEDSIAVAYRLCDSAPVGANFSCVAGITTSLFLFGVPMNAWVSNRDRNTNIYMTEGLAEYDHFVDNDSHADLHPTVSSYVTIGGPNLAWFFWQSDRTGNWDIWSVAIPGPGVEETPNAEVRAPNAATVLRRLPAGAVAFDAMGRRVVNPRPGVYFCRLTAGSASFGEAQAQAQAPAIRKVVIQR